MQVVLEREKETKNTVRFREPDGDGEQQLGIIYVPKSTVSALGDPALLQITLAAAA